MSWVIAKLLSLVGVPQLLDFFPVVILFGCLRLLVAFFYKHQKRVEEDAHQHWERVRANAATENKSPLI